MGTSEMLCLSRNDKIAQDNASAFLLVDTSINPTNLSQMIKFLEYLIHMANCSSLKHLKYSFHNCINYIVK